MPALLIVSSDSFLVSRTTRHNVRSMSVQSPMWIMMTILMNLRLVYALPFLYVTVPLTKNLTILG